MGKTEVSDEVKEMYGLLIFISFVVTLVSCLIVVMCGIASTTAWAIFG